MTAKLVTVFGGTGFLGRHISQRLVADGFRVRVAVRHPEAADAALPDSVERVRADVCDATSVPAALEGAEAVVNAVGLYLERRGEAFAATHVDGARRVAEQAANAGIPALVHISGIGVDPASGSRYVRARAAGETAVRDAFGQATILRPSVLFGPGDAFFNSLAQIARMTPVFPLFGHGDTRLQPVYAGDVAAAVAKALVLPAAGGETYELGGPRSYTYCNLIKLLLAQIGLKRALLPVPFVFWEAQAGLMQILPKPPVTHDQIVLMKRDNVPTLGVPGFADLGIEPASVEDILPNYIGPGR
ncbi:MAG: complex I NDUFA9 subunit family protein [Kiloniellales bacterium]